MGLNCDRNIAAAHLASRCEMEVIVSQYNQRRCILLKLGTNNAQQH